MVLLHNNECSKSNAALCFLNNAKVKFTVRNYLDDPLNKEEIRNLLDLLQFEALDIIRKKAPLFLNNFTDKNLSNDEWMDVLVRNPELLERPILIGDDFALIGRPPEVIDEFLRSL